MATANMEDLIVLDPNFTRADRLVLEGLIRDIREDRDYEADVAVAGDINATSSGQTASSRTGKKSTDALADADTLAALDGLNDPASPATFEPTVFTSADLLDIQLATAAAKKEAAASRQAGRSGWWWSYLRAQVRSGLQQAVLLPYTRFVGRHIVRHETDVVFVTHLLLYSVTIIPSAFWLLFGHFGWLHGLLHAAFVLGGCMGAYTIMMHQHIHQGGVLRKDLLATRTVDRLFPYLLDPLMGHTWNSYFYHHVKHHHVEGNGPDDLSSTMRFRRDSMADFGKYVGRFFFLAWLDLPGYFWRTRRYRNAVRAGFWELSSYALMVCMLTAGYRARGQAVVLPSAVDAFDLLPLVLKGLFAVDSSSSPLLPSAVQSLPPFVASLLNFHVVLPGVTAPGAAICVFILPFAILRVGLMAGNWGQHAFVNPVDPDSDFRSSVTVLDFASNRVCFNDGYHTSHHLNPRRHWRDHPRAFVRQKRAYAAEQALVFHGIDYLELTLRLIIWQDYATLARRMVPLGPQQRAMTLEERAAHLRELTAPFAEADIARLFPKSRSAAAWRRKQGLPAV